MKKIIYLIVVFFCLFGSNAMAQTTAKKKVAVYMTGDGIQDSYKKVIGARLVSTITSTDEYAAVERTADFLAALSSEQDFQTSGEVQDSQIARLGQKFGVRYVVVADVSEVFDELFVASRLINVESALVEKAFDTNAPAESMAQLIDISSKVANGLLGTGGFAQSGGISTEPTNMSLCAVKDGKVVYITPTQWEQMKESEKITFNKKGILIMDNGEAFVVAMRDSGAGDFDTARIKNAPTVLQLKMMYQNLAALNTALRLFGGKPMNASDNIYYWSSDIDSNYSNSQNCGYLFNMSNGKLEGGGYYRHENDRFIWSVYTLNQIY